MFLLCTDAASGLSARNRQMQFRSARLAPVPSSRRVQDQQRTFILRCMRGGTNYVGRWYQPSPCLASGLSSLWVALACASVAPAWCSNEHP